jgi:hypothetical protein
MHMKLFDLIIFMINLVEINFPNMTFSDCSVIFDNVITLKLKKYKMPYIYFEMAGNFPPCFSLLFIIILLFIIK